MTTGLLNRKSLVKIKDEVVFYDHQVSGVRHLARMNSFILADDMGLGKSLEALTVAAVDYERGWASRSLVICPASLKWNWALEMEEKTYFTYMILDGSPAFQQKQLEEYDKGGIDFLIVGYEQAVKYLEALNALNFDIVIYDEAHYLKNPQSKRGKELQLLYAKRHFCLTGSPMLNQVDELWALLNRVDPKSFPNYYAFRQKYCEFGGYKGKQVVGIKDGYEAKLRELLQTRMLRRLKSEVLDLPPKQVVPLRVTLLPSQRAMYDKVYEEMLLEIPSDPTPTEVENSLTKYLRLKQITSTTRTVDPVDDTSAKLDLAQERVHEICKRMKEPTVIFTQFRGVVEAMEERLERQGIPAFSLHGDVAQRDRVPLVTTWAASGPAVLIAMQQVAGVGFNMTAANKAIRIDKLWVPMLNEQCEDRLHRIGADKSQPVQIYDLIARNTIDSRIERILKAKKELFEKIVNPSVFKRALVMAMAAEEDEEEVAA